MTARALVFPHVVLAMLAGRWVLGAADVRKLSSGDVAGEPVEHAAWADRRELLAVAYGDQLCPGALYKLGQLVEALVVDYSSLVENDGGVAAHADRASVCTSDQRVQGECLPGGRWTVGAHPLSCGA